MAFLVFILLVVIIGGIVVLAMNKDNGSDKVNIPFFEDEEPKSKKGSKGKKKSKNNNVFMEFLSELKKSIEDTFGVGDGDELKTAIKEYNESKKSTSSTKDADDDTFTIHALAGDEDEESEDEVINDEEVINVTKASGDQVFKLGTHMFFVNYNSFIMDSRFVDISNPVHKTWSDGSKMDIYIKGNKVIIEYHHDGVVDRKGVIYYI